MCLFDESWHQGVVGLVASRIKERLRRPVIAFARADAQTLRGSARSIAGVHIRDVLDAIAARHPDLIEKFGGHAMAAGLTLELDKLERFARAFDAEVARCSAAHGARPTASRPTASSRSRSSRCRPQALRAGGPWGRRFPNHVRWRIPSSARRDWSASGT